MTAEPRFSFDTDAHPIFHAYSAGNFGEVAPERLSIAAWSLIGDPVERGCRRIVERFWPGATWHTGSHYTFVGYFGCRPYHNLSAFCHMTRDVPLVGAEDVTASYFEDAPTPHGLPERGAGALARVAAMRRMLRTFVDLRPRLVLAQGQMADLELELQLQLGGIGAPAASLDRFDGDRPAADSDGIGARATFALGRVFERARSLLGDAWELHYTATTMAVPLQAWQRRVAQRTVPHWDELEPWLNRPDELVWSALHEAAQVEPPLPAGEFLTSAFYEIADEREPWARYASARTRAVAAPAGERERPLSPAVAWEMVPRARLALLPQITRAVADSLALREATKSVAMRCMHVFRRLLPQLAAAAGVADADWPYLTVDEVVSGAPPAELAALAAARRDECARALTAPMPEQLSFQRAARALAPPAPAPAEPGGQARGRGVSPGVVRGVAITPADATNGAGHGAPRILVCESADADLQPLLPRVDGVVTARGSALSHVSILVREYGIPAVVGYSAAARLRPGQRLQLDGTTGEVTIIDG